MATLHQVKVTYGIRQHNPGDNNWSGKGEKWFVGSVLGADVSLYVLPNDNLYAWQVQTWDRLPGTDTLLGNFPGLHTNPSLLVNAQPPVTVVQTAPILPTGLPPVTDEHRRVLRENAGRLLFTAFLGGYTQPLSITAHNCRRLGYQAGSDAIVNAAIACNPVLQRLTGQSVLTAANMLSVASGYETDYHPGYSVHRHVVRPDPAKLAQERTPLGCRIESPRPFWGPDQKWGTADDTTIQYFYFNSGPTQQLEWVAPAGFEYAPPRSIPGYVSPYTGQYVPPVTRTFIYPVETPIQSKYYGEYYGTLSAVEASLRAAGDNADADIVLAANLAILAVVPGIEAIPGTYKKLDTREDIDAAYKIQYPESRGCKYRIRHGDGSFTYPQASELTF